ncbi:mviN-like family protein, partial [Chlamydia psittaci 06-1683]
DIVIQDNGL